MRSINEIRADIDKLDGELAELLMRRFALADEIKLAKAEAGMQVYDAGREAAVTARVCARAGNERDAGCIKEIYRTVIDVCRKRQA